MCTRIVTAKPDREPIRSSAQDATTRTERNGAGAAVSRSAILSGAWVSAPAGQQAEHHEADSHQGKEDQQVPEDFRR